MRTGSGEPDLVTERSTGGVIATVKEAEELAWTLLPP